MAGSITVAKRDAILAAFAIFLATVLGAFGVSVVADSTPPASGTPGPIVASSQATSPTAEPTSTPTSTPTSSPTVEPSPTPTSSPTVEPSATPTASPTPTPTATPTATPSGPVVNALLNPSLYGWPDASNTGPRGPVTDLGGSVDVTNADAIIAGVYYTLPAVGSVTPVPGVVLEPHSVTLTGVRMTRLRNRSNHVLVAGRGVEIVAAVGTTGAQYTVDATQTSGTARIDLEDCAVYGATVSVTVAFKAFSLARCDISGGMDAVRLGTNTSVVDSYLHDLERLPGSHNDIFQITGGRGAVVRHNTALARTGDDPMNAVLGIGNATGNISDVLFEDNLSDGGNYSVFVNWTNIDDPAKNVDLTNVRIVNNRWGTGYRYGLFNKVRSPIVHTGSVSDGGVLLMAVTYSTGVRS